MVLRALPTKKPGQPHPVLLRAVIRLLRPLVELLVANGVTYPYLAQVLKQLYVDVATSAFEIPEKTLSDSRVSVMTGVNRKEVGRLRAEGVQDAPTTQTVSLGTQIVAHWLGDRRFSNASGNPRPLPRLKRNGNPSFESLVEDVSRRDLRAGAVLDELVRLGIVEKVDGDLVRLNAKGFVPDRGFEEKAYFFGRILASHIAAAAHNLGPAPNPFLDRAVFYDGLLEQDVERLKRRCRDLGTEALESINREAMQMKRRAATSTDKKQRICFGVFYQAGPSKKGTTGEAGEKN